MQKIKEYFNKLQIISYIVATILGILYMIFKIDKLLDIALVSLLFTLYGHAYFGKKWAIYGRTWNRKNDKDFKNNEYRKYSDTIFNILYIVLVVLLVSLYLIKIDKINFIVFAISYFINLIIFILLFYFTYKKDMEVRNKIKNK